MNNLFKYSGVICLVVFSFFYTEKVISITNSKDPIMTSIVSYENNNNYGCIEGNVNKDEVVLGVSGKKVNVNRSYANMRGIGYKEELMVFEEDKCKINKDNIIGKYIIKGNESKKSVSFIYIFKNKRDLEKIIKLTEYKNIKITIAITGEELKKNKDYFKILYNLGYDTVSLSSEGVDLKKYIKTMKKINKKSINYCLYYKNNNLKICNNKDINVIKTNIIINKDLYNNIKNNTRKGNILILNSFNNDELSPSINFVKAKGLKIKTIKEHLSEK